MTFTFEHELDDVKSQARQISKSGVI